MSKQGVHKFAVGDKVQLSGKFLRSTGQLMGSEGLSKWHILGFDQDWAIVDEPADMSYFTADEVNADPTLKYRRISTANLVRVGTLSSRNCP